MRRCSPSSPPQWSCFCAIWRRRPALLGSFCCAGGSAYSRWASIPSPGQLKALGINAEVAGHLSWQNEVTEILRDRSAGRTGPLILVGHSQGANNVIDMARALEQSHVTVDLLITLSPFMQNRVPANVAKAINYYQAPGWGQPLEADQGFRGKLINVNLADDPTISHIGIDKSTKIQTEIVREIAAVK
jgi:hypothetical protein